MPAGPRPRRCQGAGDARPGLAGCLSSTARPAPAHRDGVSPGGPDSASGPRVRTAMAGCPGSTSCAVRAIMGHARLLPRPRRPARRPGEPRRAAHRDRIRRPDADIQHRVDDQPRHHRRHRRLGRSHAPHRRRQHPRLPPAHRRHPVYDPRCVASGVSTFAYIGFLPLALAFGLLTEHRGVNTAAWMITAVTAAAGVLLIALARTQGQPDSADISNQPVSPGCAPATA